MKDQARTNFRPRQIDYAKPLTMIRDINELYKKEENPTISSTIGDSIDDSKAQITFSDQEIKKILDLFDKKKTIIIPKVEKYDATGPSGNKGNSEGGAFSAVQQIYKQKKFSRPNYYIIHSQRNRLEPTGKEYEATLKDINYLKFEKEYLTVDELELAITALENDVGRGELIPQERAVNVLGDLLPEKKSYFKEIYKYWVARREDFKKSLLRKYWKEQKFTDKHLTTTFRKREREKMRTRRYKKNDAEGLLKLKSIREVNNSYLNNLIKTIHDREVMKKNLMDCNEIEFELQISDTKAIRSQIEMKLKEIQKNHIRPPKNLSEVYMTRDLYKKENLQETNTSSIISNAETKPLRKPLITKIQRKRPSEKPIVIEINKPSTEVMVKEPIKEIVKPKEKTDFKFRIRMNRYKQIVFDRFQQLENSHNPFDESYDLGLDLTEEESTENTDITLDTLLKKFKREQFFDSLITDSDDEQFTFKTNLCSGFRQFLKHKRHNNDFSVN